MVRGNGAYVDDIGMVQVELAHGAPKQVEERHGETKLELLESGYTDLRSTQ